MFETVVQKYLRKRNKALGIFRKALEQLLKANQEIDREVADYDEAIALAHTERGSLLDTQKANKDTIEKLQALVA